VSLDTSSIQYENDDLMCATSGSDYNVISCCVSRLTSGSEMQYFGARCNIAKALLYAINAGQDELSGEQIVPGIAPLPEGPLAFEHVMARFKQVMSFLAREYVKTMNVIHWSHDKYYYERLLMALLDTDVKRLMAFGIAGLSVATDSLSAIKHARVRPVRDERGIAVSYEVDRA
jgi:formate C-acetyltransferase